MKSQIHELQQSLIDINQDQRTKNKQQDIPINGDGFIQETLFLWLYSFIAGVSKNKIALASMPLLPSKLNTSNFLQKLTTNFRKQIKNNPKGGSKLSKTLFLTFRSQFVGIFLIVISVSLLKMCSPFLCALIIQYIQQRQTRPSSQGIILFLSICLLIFFRSVGQSKMNYKLGTLGLNLSSSLSMMIFCKSLKHPLLRQRQFESSDVINYSQVDCQRLTYLGNQMSAVISTPIQIIIGVILMYIFIGISFLSGVVMMVIMIGLTYFVSKVTVNYNKDVLKAKDKRMKATQQMLNSIRFIKIHGLEEVFLQKVTSAREEEIKFYKKKGIFQVIGFFVYWLASPMILAATFITYILLQNEIKSEVAFTTIMIFSILQYPIRQFPTSISEVLQILTSLKRIEIFLCSKEIKDKNYIYGDKEQPEAVAITNGNFKWRKITSKKESESDKNKLRQFKTYLKNIQLSITRESFTMIIGKIGSGKSNLFQAILNEMKSANNTKVIINGSIAYCGQKPWIMSATVKQNIINNLPYDQRKFKEVIYYAALSNDLQILPKKQLTQIGEKGVNISGGQKVRISFARALYSNCDIYLLDDILGAVDHSTAEFLMKETLLGYLKHKTLLMITHALEFIKFADQIILMEKGHIACRGSYEKIVGFQHFKNLCKDSSALITHVQKDQAIYTELKFIKQAVIMKQKLVNLSQRQKSQQLVQQLMLPEDQQLGKIKSEIFMQYIELNGGFVKFAFVVLMAMIMWILCTTFASIIMQKWCQDPQQFKYGLYIYVGLSLSSSLFILIRAYVLILSGARQGEIVNKKMISSLLGASLSKFFNRIPTGRILNRLTHDLRELDEAIGPAIGGLLVCVFQMLGTIAICIYSSTPYLVIPILVMAYACIRLKNYYLSTQREVSRIEKITNSPIINGFVSALASLQSIRAYQLQKQVTVKQLSLCDENRRARMIRQGMQSWFALNLSYLSMLVNITAIGYCLFSSDSSPALAGLLITYSLNLSSDINLSILCYAYFQTKVISLQRIYSFMTIQREDQNWGKDESQINSGNICFKDVSIRYRQDLPDVVSKFNLTIKAGEKIGIAGRTGSGKTSIFNALLGIAYISQGSIEIDGLKTDQRSLTKLRQSFTIIDQESVIINGSIRQNLNLMSQRSDSELIEVLKQTNFYRTICDKGGLDQIISAEDFSLGEKQMLCLCRALLKNSKIILIDEATANIDQKTDQMTLQVLKQKCKQSTIITIAHRLQTLEDCDRVIIMESGKIIEEGPAQKVLKKGKSSSILDDILNEKA